MIKIDNGHVSINGKAFVLRAELTTLLYSFMTDDDPCLREMLDFAYKRASEDAKKKMEGKL